MIMYLILIILFLSLCSCDDDISIQKSMLDNVHSIMEEHPDSALTILQDIDQNSLANKALKAEYSLLMSIALDKNYIDTTEFSVLQPALDYYSRYGTVTDKLKTFYYQGIIYSNQGNLASAVMSFKKALQEGGKGEEVKRRTRGGKSGEEKAATAGGKAFPRPAACLPFDRRSCFVRREYAWEG